MSGKKGASENSDRGRDAKSRKRKRKSHPTSSRRAQRQKTKDRYAHAREDAQLAGILPTVPGGPEEVLQEERVRGADQEEQKIPSLDRDAVRKGWEVPEEAKKKVIERLLEPFYEEERVVISKGGQEIRLPPDRQLLKENAKVLVLADQRQYERDHPEEAGKARGASNSSTVNNVQVNLVDDLAELFRRVDQQRTASAVGFLGEGKSQSSEGGINEQQTTASQYEPRGAGSAEEVSGEANQGAGESDQPSEV